MNPRPTIADLLDEAIAAEEELAALGESIDDEWSYINDLRTAWLDRLSDASAELAGDRPAEPAIVDAVRLAIEEAGLIRDPHRAIDWLSTLPQVILLAVGA
jgi:hypothetical protein